MIFEPHQGTTARLFGGLFLCQFLAVACFSGLSKIAYFRLILESGIKRETVRNFSPRYMGMLFLGERFRRMQWVAVALAFTGVLVQLWQFGSLPIIGLGLAFSFAFYGLLRKKIAIDAQTGMLIETLWLLPVAAAYLFLFADSPTSHLSANPWSLNLLLVAAGIVTTVPLLCFTAAATRLRLSTLGFFQYLGPTLMFLLAITFYGETVGQDKLVTFGFIWAALILFTLDALYTQRKLR